MSVLETPRILFRGNMAWDPIVTNNNQPAYDEDTAQTVYPAAPTIQAQVAAFRQQAIADVSPTVNPGTGPNRVWNPQGTHRSAFYDEAFPDPTAPDSKIVDSCISGVDVGKGASTGDAFVGSPANFTSMLVDLEPYGSYSSQLFFDSISFGIPGGCRIFAPRSARVTDRYINLGRNPVYYIAGFASVVWQTSFLKSDGLVIDAFDSDALRKLKEAVDHDDVLGLTVRWTVYRTVYYDTPALATDVQLRSTVAQELMDKLNGGGFQPNPARSKMVGVIGLWRDGEPQHEPGDRALLATQWPPGKPATPPCVATGFARLTQSSVTLDLGNSMPETGLDLAKQDWGDLQVQAVDPDDKTKLVAKLGDPIPYGAYCREAYEAGSGIVTLAVDATDAGKAAAANLQIVQVSTGTVLLDEAPLRALPLVPNLYVDAGVKTKGQFQLYERGAPAGAGIPVTLCTMDFSGSNILATTQIESGPGGIAEFPLQTPEGDINAFVPLPGPDPALPTNGINSQLNTYMYVRTLPTDDAVAALPATWANVYANVLANWNAMAPCMDNWLDLADEASILAYGPAIKSLTAPGAFEYYRFMPVTRDMTAGARTLLYNFLDGVQPAAAAPAGAVEEHVVLAKAAPARAHEPKPALTGHAAMSQAMRGGDE
jgi:hypothetical protein